MSRGFQLQDFQSRDSIGIPRFTVQQAKAMVDRIKAQKIFEQPPPSFEGRGIVIAGGGRYLNWSHVACRVIRETGCTLPIRVYFMGDKEMPRWAVPLFAKYDVEVCNVFEAIKRRPVKSVTGWSSKNIAIADSPWQHVLFLDADAFVSRNPEELFAQEGVLEAGGLFFSDVANHAKNGWDYVTCGIAPPEKEWEAGIYLVNKVTGWAGLRWAMWMNEHQDVFYKNGHGDKHTLCLGFLTSGVPILVSTECQWAGWGISQQWRGIEWARHAMAYKRQEHPAPDNRITELFWEWDSLALGKV